MGEFDLIARYFRCLGPERADVALGVGDDAALLRPPRGQALVVTLDTLVEAVHFLAATTPADIGHKALAVNLSDLAAMGAEPAWFTLSITLPRVDENWIAAFAEGLRALADVHGVRLVGGDTTRGPLAVSVQAMGFVSEDAALRRDGAHVGDGVYVTGTLGDAALGLALVQGRATLPEAEARYVRARLDRPTPRVAAGRALRGLATSAIDLSDGLAGDLRHVLQAGGVGAELECERLPLSPALRAGTATDAERRRLALCGGDDYELCFTAPRSGEEAVYAACAGAAVACTRVGTIVAAPGLHLKDAQGAVFSLDCAGFEHFPR